MLITADDLQRGIELAAKKHSKQRRKGNKMPYILHPLDVAIRLLKLKDSKHNLFMLALAAVLHDYVEDCDQHLTKKQRLAIVAKMFGYKVAALVDELTLDKEQYGVLGKKEYLAQHTVIMSPYALTIKLIDRWANVDDMKQMSKKFQKNYTEETNYILAHLEENREKITDTQWKIIGLIKETLAPYQSLLAAEPACAL